MPPRGDRRATLLGATALLLDLATSNGFATLVVDALELAAVGSHLAAAAREQV